MSFNLDLQSIISLISVLSGIVITLINVCYNIKLRKLESENNERTKRLDLQYNLRSKLIDTHYADKRDAFNDLIQSASKYYTHPKCLELYTNLQSSAYSALMFCNTTKSHENISFVLHIAKELYQNDNIAQDISMRELNAFNNALKQLVSALNEELLSVNDFEQLT